jgi:hypothetical protein
MAVNVSRQSVVKFNDEICCVPLLSTVWMMVDTCVWSNSTIYQTYDRNFKTCWRKTAVRFKLAHDPPEIESTAQQKSLAQFKKQLCCYALAFPEPALRSRICDAESIETAKSRHFSTINKIGILFEWQHRKQRATLWFTATHTHQRHWQCCTKNIHHFLFYTHNYVQFGACG